MSEARQIADVLAEVNPADPRLFRDERKRHRIPVLPSAAVFDAVG